VYGLNCDVAALAQSADVCGLVVSHMTAITIIIITVTVTVTATATATTTTADSAQASAR
jgi:hypothetical protein